MMAIASGLVYLGAVLAALAFFGALVLRKLVPELRSDPGMAIAVGIASFIAFCGLLEFTQLASRQMFVTLIVVGAAGQAATVLRDHPSRTKLLAGITSVRLVPTGALVVFGTFALLYALFLINAADWHYSFVDDLLGYLVFPQRILSEGSLGRDPFNFRRIEAGLTGGGGYLYALFRAGLDLRQTRLADAGVGSACLLLLVAGHTRMLSLSPFRVAVTLLLTLAVIVFSPIINNTPDTTGKALLFALLRLAFDLHSRPLSARRDAALALMAFALVALKTSYLPETAAIVAAFYISLIGKHRLTILAGRAMTAGAITLVFMLPWMVVSNAIAGTLWYPLLGTGTLSGAETATIVSLRRFLSDGGRVFLVLTPAALAAMDMWWRPEWRNRRFFLAAVVLCSLVLTFLSQLKFTVFGYRYGHAGAAAVMLFFVPIALQGWPTHSLRVMMSAVLAASIVMMAVSTVTGRRWIDDGWLGELVVGPEPHTRSEWKDERIAELRAMQAAVPAGEPILVLLSWPSLLDFRRNPIAVMDHGGQMGPPGRPAADDAASWARYLSRLGFHYIAYSYRDEAVKTKAWAEHDIAQYSSPSSYSAFMVADTLADIQMRETFLALRHFGKVVYDDGDQFVVHLTEKSE